MKFEDKWHDLFRQLLGKLDKDDDTPEPTPEDVGEALAAGEIDKWAGICRERLADLWKAAAMESAPDPDNPYPVNLEGVSQDDHLSLHSFFSGLLALSKEDTENRILALVLIAAGVDGSALQTIHTLYENHGAGLKHPLATLIEGWIVERSQQVDTDKRKTGIIPANLNRIVVVDSRPDLIQLPNYDEGSALGFVSSPDLQAYLPALQTESSLGAVLPLQLWDRSASRGPEKQMPLDLRIWMEGITAIPASERVGQRRISVDFGNLVEWLMPNGRYSRAAWPSMQWALGRVHNWRIPWEKDGVGGLWAAVRIVSGPRFWNAYSDPVVFDVDLPPGVNDRGPLVYRPALRKYGQQGALLYRAYLGLCWLWDHHGARRGRYIQPERRRIARNADGNMIDAEGRVIVDKAGRPAKTWMIPEKKTGRLAPRPGVVFLDADGRPVADMEQAAMERNPAADRYPILTPDQLVELSYQIDADKQVTAPARRKRRERARDALIQIAADDYCVVEDVDGGWRILPPQGWGAGFGI